MDISCFATKLFICVITNKVLFSPPAHPPPSLGCETACRTPTCLLLALCMTASGLPSYGTGAYMVLGIEPSCRMSSGNRWSVFSCSDLSRPRSLDMAACQLEME